MPDSVSNDNDVLSDDARPRGPDAHGQAAMLLVESLIHGLVAQSVISVAEAIEIVSVAAEVKEEVAADIGESVATTDASLTILAAIRQSLTIDLPG